MTSVPNACIIGAGSSGIAGAKVLAERGIAFDCFEKSDEVGGNWAFGNRNGMSAAYRSLHINTSRERMEYSDFPMPKGVARLLPPLADQAVLQRLRRPLRHP
ncbi:MAG: NAD(P)-binding protein [Solirubrobacteraceae bacterium]